MNQPIVTLTPNLVIAIQAGARTSTARISPSDAMALAVMLQTFANQPASKPKAKAGASKR